MRFASRRTRWAAATAAALGLGQGSMFLQAAEAPAASVVRGYTAPDGELFLSVSLRAPTLLQRVAPHDHVILVDTSASQVGEHREHGLQVLQNLLNDLPASDRVAVYALDLKATALTHGLVTPAEAIAEATPALNRRFPAGATNLVAGLTDALTQFDHSRPGSIILIGDGMSAAHLIQPREMSALAQSLRDARVAVHSYAVGSNRDMQLLGILAAQTGGVVRQDDGATDAHSAATELAAAACGVVFYPTSLSVNWPGAQVLPASPLPMRADRTTVYLAHGQVSPNATIGVEGSLDGQAVSLSWSVGEPQQVQGTAVLGQLWQAASTNEGLVMPLAGDELIAYAQELQVQQVATLESEGARALKDGQATVAGQVGRVLESLDPGNVRAVAFQNAAEVNESLDAPLTPRESPDPQSAIERQLGIQQALTEKLRRELELEIEEARREVNVNPSSAVQRMESALADVKAATEIDRDEQEKLLRYATSALQEMKSQQASLNAHLGSQQKALAARRASEQLEEQYASEERTLKNLVDQVRAAMLEGYHGDPDAFEQAEEIGRIIYSREPGSGVGSATVFLPEAAGHLDKASRLRSLRSDKFLAMLHQVELSHVPFPDEPPINYPPAEVWQYITQLREKWKSVDLHRNSPNEEQIYKALNSSVNFQFSGQTLGDVMKFLEDEYKITIRIDDAALQEVGASRDNEVNLVISGITLRSALKLLLEDVGGVELGYVIDDEVMKITTAEKIDAVRQVRVYPVADLAIAPYTQLMMARRSGGGGGGGMGGGMGGGGMGGGGMGGGGGGGFFSVPNAPPETLKKKP